MKTKNKILKSCLSAFMVMMTLTVMPVKAVSGVMSLYDNGRWNYKTNDPNYHVYGTYSNISVSGQPVFCLNSRVEAVNGATVTEGTPQDAGISDAQAKHMALIQYYGMHLGTPDDYAITTSMIWNYIGIQEWLSSPTAPTWSALQGYFNQINASINRYYTYPSINNGDYTLNVGDSITLTDTNGVLSDYDVSATGGLDVSKNGNTITLTAKATSDDNAIVAFQNRITAQISKTNVVYQKPGVQTVGSFYRTDPMRSQLRVKVNKFGSLKIAKKDDSGNYVPNTTFRLSYNADMSNPIGDYKTGADGTVKIDQLMGTKTVYYQEIAVPANLVIDKTIRSITIVPNQTVDVLATNQIQKGKITLNKIDGETGNKPQGEATLAGAVYGLYTKEDIIDPISHQVLIPTGTKVSERTTKADGSMDPIENLYLGKYYVQEIQAPNGYLVNHDKIDASLQYAGQNVTVSIKDVTAEDTVVSGDFQITKVEKLHDDSSGINKPEPGAQFTVVLKKYVDQYGSVEEAYKHHADFSNREYDLLTTDGDGVAKSKKLAYGTYIVKQTKAGDDQLIMLPDPFEVQIKTADQPTIKFVISNQRFLSYLQLVKKDADNGKIVTLHNASFKIFDVDNNKYVTQRVGMDTLDTWYTDHTGKVTLPLKLMAGHYRLEEVKAPDGYLINKNPIPFEIKTTNVSTVDPEGQPITVVELSDQKPTGSTELTKLDKDTQEKLAGVQYRLTAAKDIIDPADGSIIYKAGAPVSIGSSVDGYYTTDVNGKIQVTGLPLGTYSWQETKALDGYVQDKKVYTFELKQKDDMQTVYTHTQQLKNQKTKTAIQKVDYAGFQLVGADLSLQDQDGNVIDSWTSGNNPHLIEGLMVGQTYTLTENNAPEGFVKAKNVSFTVKNTEDIQKVLMKDIQVKALKIDEDNKPLSGATMQVISTKTKNIVDRWTTDGKKHAISGLLEDGSYVLQELEAPVGLKKAKDIKFTVNDNKDIQTIQMSDDYILTKIQVNKVDSITKKAIKSKDFEFTAYKDKDCKEALTTVNANTEEGTATFELRYGDWWIKETKAPLGYLLSKEVKHVEINQDGVFVNDKKVDPQNEIYSFVYYDSPMQDDVVKTGDNTSDGMYLMGLFGSGACVILLYHLRKRHISE